MSKLRLLIIFLTIVSFSAGTFLAYRAYFDYFTLDNIQNYQKSNKTETVSTTIKAESVDNALCNQNTSSFCIAGQQYLTQLQAEKLSSVATLVNTPPVLFFKISQNQNTNLIGNINEKISVKSMYLDTEQQKFLILSDLLEKSKLSNLCAQTYYLNFFHTDEQVTAYLKSLQIDPQKPILLIRNCDLNQDESDLTNQLLAI